MQCNDTLRAVFESCSRLSLPRELDITLIAEHRDVVLATPSHNCTHVIKRTGWVAWRVHPHHECTLCIIRTDLCEVKSACSGHRHSYWPATRQCRAHCITWIAHSRKQHGVTRWSAQFHPLRCGHYKFFATNTCSNLCKWNINVELALNPCMCSTAQWFNADRWRVTAFEMRCRECSNNCARRRITRVTDTEVDDSPYVLCGSGLKHIETVVRIRRWNKTMRVVCHDAATVRSSD